MTTQTLGRSRHLRLTPIQDDTLQRLAREEGCSVSDLLRRAAIRTFSLPTDATDRGEGTQNEPAPAGSLRREEGRTSAGQEEDVA